MVDNLADVYSYVGRSDNLFKCAGVRALCSTPPMLDMITKAMKSYSERRPSKLCCSKAI